jgi:hypothetical protein
VRNAPTPEAAALEGRRAQRGSPELVRQDWDVAKSEVMWDALNAKFRQNGGPRRLLLATAEMGMPYGETSLVSVFMLTISYDSAALIRPPARNIQWDVSREFTSQ